MTDEATERQLRTIAEVAELAAGSGIEVWLRGGWATDFFLGEVTRPHRDVDWFCSTTRADRLTALLRRHGYADDPGPPPDQQRDLVKDGVALSFALLARNAEGAPIVAGGPWQGTAYPAGMLGGWVGRLEDVSCPIISPHVQIELKEMYPVWMPERPVRAKDRADVARLRAAITP